jgi:DNA invertase Pin-like site-specific DNA recombinase
MEIDNYSLAKNIQKAERDGKETAFLFDRISSTRQDDGISLDYQSESGNNYAEKNGLFVVQNFTLIESAYKEKRKYFDLILSLVAKHGIKHLIFKNPDRLSRNISHTAQYKKLIEENGVTFHFYELGQKINSQSSYDEQWMFFFFILMA